MPTYRYEGDEERTYFAFGELKDGDLVTADEQPDHRFTLLDPAESQE